MAAIAIPKPPGARRVGLRIRVKPQHAATAATMFERAAFQPIYVEHRLDGNVSFWFSKQDAARMHDVIEAIPREFYALQAVVGSVR